MTNNRRGAALGYPAGEDDRRVDGDILVSTMAAIFGACGMRDHDANALARSLVAADLRGIHSHGVMRVPDYVKRLTSGGVDPRGTPRIASDRGGALVVDGGNSMGQIAASFAMAQAIMRAKSANVAVAVVGNSNHCGAMDQYALMASRVNMIGLATTNALPTMAPWGGIDRILGINPLAIALPAGEHHDLVIDSAFSPSARGKIEVYGQKGLALPDNWATDGDGLPTTDPAAALAGLMRPIGDYKGSGLALMMGLLSTMLSGAQYGTALGSLEDGAKAGADGHFFAALNIAGFCDIGLFKRRVDDVVREIHGGRRAPGADRIFVPGEREAELEALYGTGGIPLNAATLDGISEAAGQFGVDVEALNLSA